MLAQEVAKSCNKELILLTKVRPDKEKVEIISVDGTVAGKKVLLVDDIFLLDVCYRNCLID